MRKGIGSVVSVVMGSCGACRAVPAIQAVTQTQPKDSILANQCSSVYSCNEPSDARRGERS
jgi:pyruvate/2-oxoacid:ferredoxin oxidoreductase beta subunit